MKNKEKQLAAQRAWYAKQTPEWKAAKNIRNKENRKKYYDYVDFRKTPCVVCGESDIRCIDFHHPDASTKLYTIADLVSCKYKVKNLWKVLEEEIDKCVSLCANCHRKLHARDTE